MYGDKVPVSDGKLVYENAITGPHNTE